MKYEWPDKIVIIFLKEKIPIIGLIVHCILTSKFKNDFAMNPLKTNENGEIELMKKKLSDVIKTSKEEYPMDYFGELSDCVEIKIIVEDKEGLEKRLDRLKEFYLREAEVLESIMKDCSNLIFKRFEEKFKLPLIQDRIVVKLEEA